MVCQRNFMKRWLRDVKNLIPVRWWKTTFKMKKDVMDRIMFGSSINISSTPVRFWRDYSKLFVHPDFNSPLKPAGFRYFHSPFYHKLHICRLDYAPYLDVRFPKNCYKFFGSLKDDRVLKNWYKIFPQYTSFE